MIRKRKRLSVAQLRTLRTLRTLKTLVAKAKREIKKHVKLNREVTRTLILLKAKIEKNKSKYGPASGKKRVEQDLIESFIHKIMIPGQKMTPKEIADLVIASGYETTNEYFSATCRLILKSMNDVKYNKKHRGIYVLKVRKIYSSRKLQKAS